MKKLLPAILLATTFFACKKNDDAIDANAMTYTVNGVVDKTVEYDDSFSMPILINHTGGNQEKVTLSLEGLPSGSTATFDPTGGTPNFSSLMSVKVFNPSGGTYNLKVNSKVGDVTKSTGMVLTVKPEPAEGCAGRVTGNYSNTMTGQFSGIDPVTIVWGGAKNEVIIKNIKVIGDVKCQLDCAAGKINIPAQLTNKALYVESTTPGTYTSVGVIVDITVRTSQSGPVVANQNCNMLKIN